MDGLRVFVGKGMEFVDCAVERPVVPLLSYLHIRIFCCFYSSPIPKYPHIRYIYWTLLYPLAGRWWGRGKHIRKGYPSSEEK